jgi:hypothetical protein
VIVGSREALLDAILASGGGVTIKIAPRASRTASCRRASRSPAAKNDVAIVIGAWGSLEAQNCDNVTVRDNVSRKYKGPWKDSWVWTGNVESNDEITMPPGWVEIRPERVSSGRRAGRYGQG